MIVLFRPLHNSRRHEDFQAPGPTRERERERKGGGEGERGRERREQEGGGGGGEEKVNSQIHGYQFPVDRNTYRQTEIY